MTVDVEIGGRRYRAAVVPSSGGARSVLRVTLQALDGDAAIVEHVVDVRETDLGVSWVHTADGRVVDAAVTERGSGETLVQLPRADVAVLVDGKRRHDARSAGNLGTGDQRICAPMPGRIVRVLVQQDDAVTAGQALVVIEAMKMENALTASRDGRVREVAVVEGSSVEAGRLLVVVT